MTANIFRSSNTKRLLPAHARFLLVSPSATNRALFTGEGALERRLGGESAPQKGSRGSATGAGTDVGEAVRES